jgi:hypothetical protein
MNLIRKVGIDRYGGVGVAQETMRAGLTLLRSARRRTTPSHVRSH